MKNKENNLIADIKINDRMEEGLRIAYLKDNENLYKNLQKTFNYIKQLISILNKFNVNIEKQPWYKNFNDIYIPMASEHYCYCKRKDVTFENISERDDIWMRSNFKSFISEIEKFIKFINKELLDIKSEKFKRAIEDLLSGLDNLNFPNIPPYVIPKLKSILKIIDSWRDIWNQNKHDSDICDVSYITKDRKLIACDSDVLAYVSIAICELACPLLQLLIVKNRIKNSQSTK